MATLVVYAKTSDGFITSMYDEVYATARAGAGTLMVDTAYEAVNVGQNVGGQYTSYACYEAFFQYDTSSLPGTAIVSAVKEELYLYSDHTVTNYTEEVRTIDWGTELTTADYVAGANLGNYTLLSSKAVSPSAGYNEFPTSANFVSAINKTGDTRLFHSSSRHRIGNEPSGAEFALWYSTDETGTDKDPKLTIDYYIGGGSESTTKISAIGGGYQALYGGSESAVHIKAVGAGYAPNVLRFLQEPVVSIQNPVATHVIVTSPTNTYTAYVTPEPAAADRIERAVTISEGNATVCQAVAEALIARWGVEQITVTGRIPLTLILDFKEYVYISIPFAGIAQEMQLQSKVHTIGSSDAYTTVTLGSVYVGDNELIARILEEMG
jgi:hypothetical protein